MSTFPNAGRVLASETGRKENGDMSDENGKKKLADFYIGNVRTIGALYSIVPTAIWFGIMFAMVPFREVYVLRLVLSVVLGGILAAWVNKFGLGLWLIKHRSQEGPATILDGVLLGGAVGFGTTLIPPLTSLIYSNHLEDAKWFIIVAWLAATVIGAVIGGVLASIGRKCLKAGAGKG